MRPPTLILLLLLLFSNCSAQETIIKSLIVAEFRKDSTGTGSYTYLVRYNFQKGALISKDTILGAPVTRENIAGSYVRFDLGKNFIYQNRYVVSGTGNVVDLKNKNLVIEESDEFVASSGDSLVFYRDNIFNGTGYLVLDLNKRKYGFVKDNNYRNIKGLLSPDLKHGIDVDQSHLPYRVLLCTTQSDCNTVVDDCGHGTTMSRSSSSFPEVPIFWLDNSIFVYAKYSSAVEIRKVNIQTKTNELVAVIDSVPPAVSNAYFSFDLKKELLFTCSKGTFKINPNLKTINSQTIRDHGNHFSSELKMDEQGIEILYKNEIIGKLWCNSYDAVTTADYFAVEYGDKGSNLGYPKGFKVWTVEKQEWVTIDVPWLCAIIGWTE